MSRKLRPVPLLVVFILVLLGLLSTGAQTVFAQAPDPPLNFGNNFFVTGDYLVAGAYGINTNFTVINGASYTTGVISVPDPNPGITGVRLVPLGAQIVDAVLYWETAEKVGVTPGGPGSGQNGFFRPLWINRGPSAPGYPISGVNLSNGTTVGWSSGGCTGTSTGKVLQTYRADVVGYLPQDQNGNVLVNGQFEVRLPSVGNSTPLTLGATLVVIYRVTTNVSGAAAPLDAVVIYEGAYAPTSTSLTMTQTIQGFYQAGNDRGKAVVSRLTHIVGNGKSNKYQTVYLDNQALPSLYGKSEPAFPGYYGTWDNPTWTFPSPNSPNPILANASSATTEVVPSMSNQGCVSWGTIIVGTTVQDTDQDGILDMWKANQGYTDVGTGLPVSLADIPLNPANAPDPPQKGHKDVFIQLDYVTEPGNVSFEPTTQVLQNVHDAFLAHNIHLHFTGFNPIPEGECTDSGGLPTCPYPNQSGVTTWRGGLEFVKNYLIPLPAFPGVDCTQVPQDCGPRFPQAQKDSYHYVVFGDSVGDASWSLSDGSLASVVAKGNTVTFTTAAAFPTGMPQNADDTTCTNGRVSIADAISNPSLNGTYCVQNYTTNSFTITIPTATNASYTHATDPNLAVATGQAISRSGTSDLGGAVSLITLGLWGADGQSLAVQEGTLMHELGHTFYLPHGGVFYNPAIPYVPIFEANCKPNYQSVMSYMFQVDLLDKYDPANNQFTGGFLDFSPDTLNTLTIGRLPTTVTALTTTSGGAPTYGGIKWYAPGTPVGTPATRYCDGTPLPSSPPPSMVLLEGTASAISPAWTANQNIDFDPPNAPLVLHGFSDWANLDLRQIGATGSSYELGGAFPKGGGAFPKGGGAFPTGGGAFPTGGGAYPRGGGAYPRGGGLSGGDINHQTANSVTRPPRNLAASEGASARTITLNWSAPTFGQIGAYNIYRSIDGGHTFPLLTSVDGNPPATTYTDTATCNTPNGYQYFVTAVLYDTTQESVPSNTVVVTANNNKLTACYTNTPPAVALNNLSFGNTNPAAQGTIVPITWTLQVDNTSDYPSSYVTNLAANSLYAIGPVGPDSNDNCTNATQGRIPLIVNGAVQNSAGMFSLVGNTFTFNWNTDAYCAGSYTFELDLDSGQKETTATSLTLNIDINDQNTPRITTLGLPNGTLGAAYSDTLTADGGTAPLTWTVSGLPAGISQSPAGSAVLAGTACLANTYAVNASVTDAKGNTGSQAFSLLINKATTTTTVMSSVNPSVFQQPVTFTVTVAPQYSCTPTGTVTLSDGGSPIASLPLPSGGIVTFTTSALAVGVHSITASYSGDANFNSSSAVYSQTVNKASTQISFNQVLPSTPFVGQPITVSYTFSVVGPGAGSPIPPSGNITVLASDGSTCMAAAFQGAGMCTLSPAPTAAGPLTFTITYPGDGNFVASGDKGGYTVYKLVFTTQPSNTGVGFTITPAVVVTAEDGSTPPNTLTTFTGSITLAIGSGPGTLSGTIPQIAVNGVATFGDLSINQAGNGDTLVASPTGGLPAATSNPFDIDTFYVDGNGNFGTLDLANGAVTQIGSGTAPGNTGLDLTPATPAPGLQVYEYNTSNQLVQITPSTGAAAVVGTGSIPDPGLTTTGGLTNGSYFGIDMVTGILYSIAVPAGTTAPVGSPTSTALVPAGCPFETSLAGSATMLYYTIGSTGGGSCAAFTDTLYQIDPTSGATTPIGPVTIGGSGVNEFAGSAFVGGTLYGFTSSGGEYTINTTTGVATFVTNTTALIFGAGDSQ